jgi:hypothetical protein
MANADPTASGKPPRDRAAAGEPRETAPSSKASLVNAFSALLGTESSAQPAPQPAGKTPQGAPPPADLSDAAVEAAVQRVLVRMTDEKVRRIVVETAERLIREEIDKIKANSE